MTIIHFVRHGQVHNPQRLLYGRLPRFPLSAAGREEAEAAAIYLCRRPLAAVFSSPRLRALQTARIIASHHPGLRVRISHLLDETHTPHEGRPLAELEASGWDMFTNIPPHYEQPEDIFNRAQRFIRWVRRRFPHGEVVAVSHGELLLWMHLWVRGLPFTLETQFLIDPFPETASITTLTFADEREVPTLTYYRPY